MYTKFAKDNILERLVARSSGCKDTPKVVRLGHPARVSEQTKRHTLEHLISVDENTEIVADVRSDIERTRRTAGRSKDRTERQALYAELKILRRYIK